MLHAIKIFLAAGVNSSAERIPRQLWKWNDLKRQTRTQLLQRGRAMLHVIECFATSLKIIRNNTRGELKQSKLWICIAHRCERASCATDSRKSALISSPSARHSAHTARQRIRAGLMYHARCLLTSSAFAGYSF